MIKITLKYSLLVLFVSVFFNTARGQNSVLHQKITIKFSNTSVEEILKRLENKINHTFTFDESLINKQKKVSGTYTETPLKECLQSILNDSLLAFTLIDNHIVIKRKFPGKEKINTLKTDSLPKPIVVEGKIIDAQTGKTVPFASISIKDKPIGVISNINGKFILKIPFHLKEEKLLVSHIGFYNLIFSINSLKNKYKVFRLKPKFVSIQEIIIRNTDGRSLVKSALKKIPENYSILPVYYTGFYRESIKRRNDYMFLSEAVLKIYKPSYQTGSIGQIKVLKSRKMKNVTNEDTLVMKIKSGLQTSLVLDLVKNKSNFLDTEEQDFYDFKMSDIVSFNNKNCYAVDFKQKEYVSDALYQGTIYIETGNLAVVGIRFRVNPSKLSKLKNSYVIKKKRGVKVRLLNTEYLVTYRQVGNKYYLNYLRAEVKMKLKKRKKMFPTLFETTIEMAVSNVDTLNVKRFPRKETEKLTDIFSDVEHEYDETFWEGYNFIKPEDSWEQAIKKIHEKLNK